MTTGPVPDKDTDYDDPQGSGGLGKTHATHDEEDNGQNHDAWNKQRPSSHFFYKEKGRQVRQEHYHVKDE